MTETLPLEGFTVLDACVYLAGPFAALTLADLGAEVVKVEPPEGDPMRRFGKLWKGTGAMFINMNRGKRVQTLDLKDPEALAEFRRLAARSDVLLENWRPGVADRLGLTDESLWAGNPRLVHCSVTGFGHSGPRSRTPAFDTVVQALSGLAWFHSREGRPQPLRTYVVDKLTGLFAAQAVLAALLQRERTGAGSRVDVDMLSVAAYFNFPDLFATRTGVDDDEQVEPEKEVGQNSVLPTSDGWVAVAPNKGAQVKRACEAVGHPEWIAELKQAKDTQSVNRILMSNLASVTGGMTTAEAVAAFEAHDVPAAPVLDLDGAIADPQAVHAGIYPTRQDPDLGELRSARYPGRFTAAPMLGGHA